jgi:predicted porin
MKKFPAARAGSASLLLAVAHAHACAQQAQPQAPEAATAGAVRPAPAPPPALSVTIYGRLDASIDRVTSGGQTSHDVVDNASRLGFRGTEDLGGGLRAVFGIEYGFRADTGAFASASVPLRNAYVGLVGPFGAVAAGRLDSANPTGSPLYSQVTKATDPVVHDAGAAAIGTDVLNARNRVSNAIGYLSPGFSGVTVRVRGYLAGPAGAEDDGKKLDIGVNYENGPVYAGVGYGRNRGTIANDDLDEKLQLVGSYDFGSWRAYGIVGEDRFIGTPGANVGYWLLGSTHEQGPHEVTANYMEREGPPGADGRAACFQVGYSRILSRRTRLYVLHDDRGDFEAGTGRKTRTFSAGIQHNF